MPLSKMPSFRGIEISIVTQSEFGRLPEYPHPVGSCVQSLGKHEATNDGHQLSFVSGREDAVANGSTDARHPSSKVSVYIPSLPGPYLLLFVAP